MTMKHNIYLGGRKEREHPGLKEGCIPMTPVTEHPLRCETCNNYHTSKKGVSGDCVKLSHWLLASEFNFAAELGCASHSASSDKVLEEIEAGISAYVKEHEHQQAKDNKGIYKIGRAHV